MLAASSSRLTPVMLAIFCSIADTAMLWLSTRNSKLERLLAMSMMVPR